MKNKQLQRQVVELNQSTDLFLSFSRGKDSIAAFLECYESGIFRNYKMFLYYLCPGLSFVDEYVNYFEKRFGFKIIQYPSTTFLDLLESGCLQTPIGVAQNQKMIDENKGFFSYKRDKLTDLAREDFKLSSTFLCANGIKASDSPLRSTALKKKEGLNTNNYKWYPIWNYSNQEIAEIIVRHDVKLPKDYEYWGLTIDGFDYRFVKYIKENLPSDWKVLQEYFPKIDLVYYKHQHYFGDTVKRAKFTPYLSKYNLQIL